MASGHQNIRFGLRALVVREDPSRRLLGLRLKQTSTTNAASPFPRDVAFFFSFLLPLGHIESDPSSFVRSSYLIGRLGDLRAPVGVGNLVELETHRVSLCIPKGVVTWERRGGGGGNVVQVVMSQLEIMQGW